MTISMHKASAPVFLRMLTNLDQLLVKAEENAKARGFDPNLLVTQRLAPDMRPLSSQIQLASDSAKGAMARLSGGGQAAAGWLTWIRETSLSPTPPAPECTLWTSCQT